MPTPTIISLEETHYYPPEYPGLETLVRFPDGDVKSSGIPNSTLWVFNAAQHEFRPEIHGSDVGCGMTAFIIDDLNHQEAADTIYHHLRKKRRLGRGNHFVDICSSINGITDISDQPYKILLVHTHGSTTKVPLTLHDAIQQQQSSTRYRQELSEELARLVSSNGKVIGDWVHNSVEQEDDKILYRKGLVKVQPDKLYFLPSSLGAKIILYTVPDESLLPYASMPHATGRSGPRGKTKVSLETAASIRELAYIPADISNGSLRTEHPSCFNNYDKIYSKLRNHNGLFFVPVGETTILSYIGKV
ncbi:RtcB family protein [Candidatus Woesearchaeota archaeon]|nr:RtcB family protein [Candidatus Woesearchaeota archaeon]